MARAETANLQATLSLTDNLSGPLKAAKASVDATAQSVVGFDQKLAGARTGIARFASAGSQLALVGSTIGGSFGGAVGPVSDFIRVAGNLGLVASTVADLGSAAKTTSVAVNELAAAQNAAGAASTGFLTRFGPLAVVLTATALSLKNVAEGHARNEFESNRDRDALVALTQAQVAGKSATDAHASALGDLIHAIAGVADDVLTTVSHIERYQQAAETAFGRNVTEKVEAQSDAFNAMQKEIDKLAAAFDRLSLSESTANAALAAQLRLLGEVAGAGVSGGLVGGGGPQVPPSETQNFTPEELAANQFASDEAERRRREREAAAAEAARKAKQAAEELARAYHDKVEREFDAARKTADTLFDALHKRTIDAIDDAAKLAQTRHDNTAQAIADQLKLEQAAHAVPVTNAEEALQRRTAEQSRRNLVEAQQAAQQALQANRDPARAEDLQRSLRAATEALQNFDAQAAIDRLKVIQETQDAASEAAARRAAGINDAELQKAKQQADTLRDQETINDKKRRDRFEDELKALQARDEKAGKSPAQIQKDIDALSAKFGITIDPITGFHHIADPLVNAIKGLKPEAHVTLVNNQQFRLILGANEIRLLATAIQTSANPQSNTSTRTGTR